MLDALGADRSRHPKLHQDQPRPPAGDEREQLGRRTCLAHHFNVLAPVQSPPDTDAHQRMVICDQHLQRLYAKRVDRKRCDTGHQLPPDDLPVQVLEVPLGTKNGPNVRILSLGRAYKSGHRRSVSASRSHQETRENRHRRGFCGGSRTASVLDTDRERVLGRLDDLEARLVPLDGDLRRISAAVESPFMQRRMLQDARSQITDDFTARSGIDPDVRLEGKFSRLTDSQYIALVGLIREALSNIREHSGAKHVSIELVADREGVRATVADDGRGFDAETRLCGRAGVAIWVSTGMHERVRMLGGRTEIDSRPGGPTVISIRIPPAPEGAPRRSD